MGSSSRRTKHRKALPAGARGGPASAPHTASAAQTERPAGSAAPARVAAASVRASRKRKKRPPLWLVLAGVAVALIAVFSIYRSVARGSRGDAVAILPSRHVAADTKPTYNSNPPTSGLHTAQPAPWGVTTQLLPDIALVHNLEHGGIVFQYRADLDATQLQQLTSLAGELQRRDRKVVLAPRAENDAPITATAWGRILKLQTFNADELRAFFDANINQGPEREP